MCGVVFVRQAGNLKYIVITLFILVVTTPAIPSPIDEKYSALGGPSGLLGAPITQESVTPDGVGHFRNYGQGSIYWTPQTGAHAVYGAIGERWEQLGRERSYLKY